MKKKVIIEYEDSDYELLKIDKLLNLPVSPCNRCGYNGRGCCGCTAEEQYSKAWQPYEDNDLVDIAKKIIQRHNLQIQLANIQDEIDELTREIPSNFIYD